MDLDVADQLMLAFGLKEAKPHPSYEPIKVFGLDEAQYHLQGEPGNYTLVITPPINVPQPMTITVDSGTGGTQVINGGSFSYIDTIDVTRTDGWVTYTNTYYGEDSTTGGSYGTANA